MRGWRTVALSDLCEIRIGRTPSRSQREYWGIGHPWLSIADMNQGRLLNTTKEQITQLAADIVMGPPVPVGTVLLSFKLSIGKVGISQIPIYTNEAIAALPIKDSAEIDAEFLYWTLRTINLTGEVDRAAMGQTLNKSKLARLRIPIPSLLEQRRIVKALDRVDALRAKRREAIRLLDDLAKFIFLDMFGDPVRNPMGWDVHRLGELLAMPLRNGLSPSSNGKVAAKVLTLSAITGARFDPAALKVGTFMETPPHRQCVQESDFLICRGNGNKNLVGRGFFPPTDMSDVAFPDTMIAARVSKKRIRPSYLEHIWSSRRVRNQLEQSARTTNGTFKVNQTMLEEINLPLPPLELQEEFSDKIRVVSELRKRHVSHLTKSDSLFSSVQHRAFHGEL